MDPLGTILAALAAGVVEAAKPAAALAVKDAYAGLKALLARKLGGAPNADDAAAALRQVEKKPDDAARLGILGDELAASGVAGDAELGRMAQAVLALARQGGASVQGSGALSQGLGAMAAGAGGVIIGGGNTGSVNTGTQITTNYYTGAPEGGASARPASALEKQLYEALNGYAFSLDDLEDLAFELGVDWGSLRGEAKGAKARALIDFFVREDRLDELLRAAKAKRPRYGW